MDHASTQNELIVKLSLSERYRQSDELYRSARTHNDMRDRMKLARREQHRARTSRPPLFSIARVVDLERRGWREVTAPCPGKPKRVEVVLRHVVSEDRITMLWVTDGSAARELDEFNKYLSGAYNGGQLRITVNPYWTAYVIEEVCAYE